MKELSSMVAIELTTDLIIGKGLDRECFLHPDDQTKCIKVTFSGDYRQHNDEIKYYSRLQNRKISWQHLSRYHGQCQTNLGDGLIFDVVRDHDGTISNTLDNILRSDPKFLTSDALIRQLNALNHYLLNQEIIMRDLKGDNILLQHLDNDDFQLVVIDGVGNNQFIPISELSSALKRRRIKQKWSRFIGKLYKSY